MMQSPPFIRPGSLIRIVSPAGAISSPEVLESMVSRLREEGYEVETGSHSLGCHFQYSGTDEERLVDLQEALDDRKTAVILSSRGGYGTIRIVEQLDLSSFRRYPKWVVGYSDITVLHNLLQVTGYQSVHGMMCRIGFKENVFPSESLESLLQVLRGEKPGYRWPSLPQNRAGNTAAPLTGGNLAILYSLTGTPYDIDTRGKILFIEDIGEYLYQLDRMMISLRLAGKFDHLAALLVGDFSQLKDNDNPFGKDYREIILDAVKGYNFPVVFGFPAGHEMRNLALLLGGNYQLRAKGGECSLKLLGNR